MGAPPRLPPNRFSLAPGRPLPIASRPPFPSVAGCSSLVLPSILAYSFFVWTFRLECIHRVPSGTSKQQLGLAGEGRRNTGVDDSVNFQPVFLNLTKIEF